MLRLFMFSSLLFAALLSFSATAGCDGSRCSGRINTFAGALQVTADDVRLLLRDGLDTKSLPCSLMQDNAIRLPVEARQFDSLYALLLTAFAANAEVELDFDLTSRSCQLGSVRLLPAN